MSEKREKSLKIAQFDDSCMQGCPEFEGTVAEEQGQRESNPFVEILSIPQYVSKKIWNESAELSCICSSPIKDAWIDLFHGLRSKRVQ